MNTWPSLSPKENRGHPHYLGLGEKFPWGQDPCLGSQEPGEASAFTVTKSHDVNKLLEDSYLRWGLQMAGPWVGRAHQGMIPLFLWQKFLGCGCPRCGPACGLPGSEVRDGGSTHGVFSLLSTGHLIPHSKLVPMTGGPGLGLRRGSESR